MNEMPDGLLPVPDGRGGGSDVVAPDLLMRYLDGELSPDQRRSVESALSNSTELQRELSLYRAMHEDLSGIRLRGQALNRSVWARVNTRLTRPMGWLLLNVGIAIWVVYGVWVYFSSAVPTWEKLTTAAVVIGILLLFASVIHDRYREWLTDPYRDVQR